MSYIHNVLPLPEEKSPSYRKWWYLIGFFHSGNLTFGCDANIQTGLKFDECTEVLTFECMQLRYVGFILVVLSRHKYLVTIRTLPKSFLQRTKVFITIPSDVRLDCAKNYETLTSRRGGDGSIYNPNLLLRVIFMALVSRILPNITTEIIQYK